MSSRDLLRDGLVDTGVMLSIGVQVVEWLAYEADVSASSSWAKGVPPGVGRPLLAAWKDIVAAAK